MPLQQLGAWLALAAVALQGPAGIPRTWDAAEVADFELPLAVPAYTPQHVPEDYYYRLPVRPVFRSYPIYHPDREPPGYREWLARQAPEVVFGREERVGRPDWAAAGELVFSAPIGYNGPVGPRHVTDPAWYAEVGVPLASDGVMPYARWVIRRQGVLEVGNLACAMCHTRVLPDGAVVPGAQGNFPFDRSIARDLAGAPLRAIRAGLRPLTFVPWAADDPAFGLPRDRLLATLAGVPGGVVIRHGTSVSHPARVPDLIGIRERRYLDATGLVRHRSIGDLMRYSAANQTIDMLARYGSYMPAGVGGRERPAPGQGRFVGTGSRYSDAQLYALARYLYALEPPPNPNPPDERARAGRAVFEREGCGRCHTPPLYTNNRLLPVSGFRPPPEHRTRYRVQDEPIDTDPGLTLRTRRGTGYYKVPSLKGLWYRGPLGHSGSVAALEDWLDPARLRPGYRPTGFPGPGGGARAVPGHGYGLALGTRDRAALIAFLRTL